MAQWHWRFQTEPMLANLGSEVAGTGSQCRTYSKLCRRKCVSENAFLKICPSMGSWCIRLAYTVARPCVFSLARRVKTYICYDLTFEVLTWEHRLLLSVHGLVMAVRAWCKLQLCKLREVADETSHLVKKYYAYPNSACDWWLTWHHFAVAQAATKKQ